MTDRDGPDGSPKMSPDGKKLAYTGYDDKGISSALSSSDSALPNGPPGIPNGLAANPGDGQVELAEEGRTAVSMLTQRGW